MEERCTKCRNECHCDSPLKGIVKGFNNYSKEITICEKCECPRALTNFEENNND